MSLLKWIADSEGSNFEKSKLLFFVLQLGVTTEENKKQIAGR